MDRRKGREGGRTRRVRRSRHDGETPWDDGHGEGSGNTVKVVETRYSERPSALSCYIAPQLARGLSVNEAIECGTASLGDRFAGILGVECNDR